MISRGGHPVAGFALGAPCPSNPPPPAGYVVWRGPVPPELTQWAIVLRDQLRPPYPFTKTWTMGWGGETVIARIDRHSWTYRRSPDGTAKLLIGLCIPGVTLYRQASYSMGLHAADATDPATALPDPDLALYSVSMTRPPERTDWPLVVVCAGAIATVSGMFALGIRAAGT